ncbi:MAG: alpha,alpha-trehalase [Victivallaceae bacterium]|nr:alpha,alpha-trehalase [Victivallaceae bacterium]
MQFNQASKQIVTDYFAKGYQDMFRDAGKIMKHPFIVPGGISYTKTLWDWDSYWCAVFIFQLLKDINAPAAEFKKVLDHSKGCVYNFLDFQNSDGYIPINIHSDEILPHYQNPELKSCTHKPFLAQFVDLISQAEGDYEWIRGSFWKIELYLNYYLRHYQDTKGIFFWLVCKGLGIDNDPAVYCRPPKSTGAIYLNAFLYEEFKTTAKIAKALGRENSAQYWQKHADKLEATIQEYFWDDYDGLFYSVDLQVETNRPGHTGINAFWHCLPMKIKTFACFIPMTIGLATTRQAEKMLAHIQNPDSFRSPCGIRSVSKSEKMYNCTGSRNPSNWLGPVWGVSNYMVFHGLKRYGYHAEAAKLANETLEMFANDLRKNKVIHEYYIPETGEGVMNPGFFSWNGLVLNMIAACEKCNEDV